MKAIRLKKLAIIAGASMVASVLCADSVPEGFGSDVDSFLSFAEFETGKTWSGTNPGLSNWFSDKMSGAYGSIDVLSHLLYPGGRVSVSDDVPGRYLYATAHATEPMVANYKSLSLSDAAGFSTVTLPDVQSMGDFTIEMFVKPEIDNGSRTAMLWGYLGATPSGSNANLLSVNLPVSTGSLELAYGEGNGTTMEVPIRTSSLRDSKWHHLALIYKNGKLRLCWDYSVYSLEKSAWINTGVGPLRFWAGNGMHYSAFRISKKALVPDEMMHASDSPRAETEPFGADTVAFLPMTGFESGTRWTVPPGQESSYTDNFYNSFKNILNTIVGNPTGGPLWLKGSNYLTVSNEVPGKYLYASAASKNPLVTDYMSMAIVGADPARPDGAFFDSTIFASAVKKMCEENGGLTMELFVKPNQDCEGCLLWFDLGDNNASCRIQVNYPPAGSSNVIEVIRFSPGQEKFRFMPNSSADVRDSKWHHLAFVCTATGKTGWMQVYYDYKPYSGVGFAVTGLTPYTGGACRFGGGSGSKGWPGLISAVRVSNAKLTPAQMLHVADTAESCGTAAFYPLDDLEPGQVVNREMSRELVATDTFTLYQCDSVALNRITTPGSVSRGDSVGLRASYDEGDTEPGFVATNDVPAKYVFGGVRSDAPLKELQSSLRMVGDKQAYVNLPNPVQDILNADEFTLEFFAKFSGDYGSDPFSYLDLGTDVTRILLSKPSNGNLRADYTVSTVAKSSGSLVYGNGSTFADGLWHHFALVWKDGQMTFYGDYSYQSVPFSVAKGALAPGEFRICAKAPSATAEAVDLEVSCIRVSTKALSSQDFLYASDNPSGMLAADAAGWNWRFDGTVGAVAGEASSIGDIIEDGQYGYRGNRCFLGRTVGDGSPCYASPVIRGRRKIDGEFDGKNKSSASTDGAYYVSDRGPLCDPGTLFTLEVLANAIAPTEGSATVAGAENANGNSAWNLAVGADGALYANIRLKDGSVSSHKAMDGFAGAPHHVALTLDARNREVKVYVDYVEALALTGTDLPLPIATDGSVMTVGGGCGNSILTGSVDEVRLSRTLLPIGSFVTFEELGFMLLIN